MKSIAIKAAKEAAKNSLPLFGQTVKSFRKVENELVTALDIESEQIIKKVIKESFPDHNFLGEEEGKENKNSQYTWIIDPIDGTVNYSRGLYVYGISIALSVKKKVILGVVYNPVLDEIFVAENGKGSTLNGEPIRVSNNPRLDEAVIYSTELYKSGKFVQTVYQKVKQFRITSSSAYETCLVASGKTEAFIKVTSHPWGFAAASLIVEEAGGKVSNFDGSPWNIDSTQLLISNGKIHNELLKLIKK